MKKEKKGRRRRRIPFPVSHIDARTTMHPHEIQSRSQFPSFEACCRKEKEEEKEEEDELNAQQRKEGGSCFFPPFTDRFEY